VRVVVVGVLAESMLTLRGDMLAEMSARGHEVIAVAPERSDEVREALAARGVEYRTAPIYRTGMHPVRDLRTIRAIYRLCRDVQPDILFVYAVKPVIYGSIAGRLARVRMRAAMITGVGSVLSSSGGARRRFLGLLVRTLYRLALRGVDVVLFQNPDDIETFRSRGLLAPRNRVTRVNGSGVNLDRFPSAPLPDGPPTFLLICRLIRDKGIYDYVAAARIVRRRDPQIRMQVLGDLDTNPTAVTRQELDAWREEGAIEYLGVTNDVRPYLAKAHGCVLPSFGEGVPRSVLEAMAMARPVIVTDVPGCRETVEPGVNGMLVPVRDPGALADAIVQMARSGREQLEAMGVASRKLAEERFDVHLVNADILDALGLGSDA
jgi:glycosyltransferase involved in cell wall biosynthesis